MGLSNTKEQENTQPEQKEPAPNAGGNNSFGGRLEQYFKGRYPVASGLAGMIFDPNNQQPQQQQITPGQTANNSLPDYSSLIAQNAVPRAPGIGLSTIIKLLSSGGSE
jgi:hypothetical protein